MTNTNRPHHPKSGVSRSARVNTHAKSYKPRMLGNHYAYDATQMAEQEGLYPDAHVFFNYLVVYNEPQLTAVIMNQLSLK